MYLSSITIDGFRCFGTEERRFELRLKKGLTALVGENDSGKTAVVDALRFIFGTTDQEWYRLEDTDFYEGNTSNEIKIVCKFEELSQMDKRAFIEYLTYEKEGENEGKMVLYVHWTGKETKEKVRGQPNRRMEVRSGKNGDGPILVPEVRELLRATYLRPLRDAEQALSAGRGSRLSQVLQHTDQIKSSGEKYVPGHNVDPEKLNLLGIGDFANDLIKKQKGIEGTRGKIDHHLASLSLMGKELKSNIQVSGEKNSDEARLRQLLEKLDVNLGGNGRLGLGSNNLLYMACELLLLAQESEGNKLLLIEEPEAHLHPQSQLLVMKFLQEQARDGNIQIIVTTHSPHLASAIELENMVMIRKGGAYSMARSETALDASDYGFLKRFLDVTKANLFFARGVVIVEGDAENILLPTLAKLLERDFTRHGVSIVNVGGLGLSRYARIFLRKDPEGTGSLDVPVACVTDMDVLPDCAPVIIERIKRDQDWPEINKRKWRAKRDFQEDKLKEQRNKKSAMAAGQAVKTFVSDEWTFEYDLALGPKGVDGNFTGGLGEDVYIAACLAEQDEAIKAGKNSIEVVEREAFDAYSKLKECGAIDNCTVAEVLASYVYEKFAKGTVSKAIAAQYLAQRLEKRNSLMNSEIKYDKSSYWRTRLPLYLVDAIEHVTGGARSLG